MFIMDIQTARIIIPKLDALRAFIRNVAYAGQYLPDNQTRANYRAIYADIQATLNDANLEIYAPPLPHLGTTSDDSTLWGEHQMRILDSGTRLIAYLESQLMQFFPPKNKASSALPSKPSQGMSTSISIENFQGVLGNVDHSTVTQKQELLVIKGDFGSLRNKLSELSVEQSDIDELQTALESEPVVEGREKFGQKVGTWIGKMVQKSATGVWDISVNTAGNILAILIAKYYGF
jgi:hypothetical protein